MMNVPCMALAAKPARTPTGHTDAAAQKDTSYSPTGYLAKPNKVSGTLALKNIIMHRLNVSFLIINREVLFIYSGLVAFIALVFTIIGRKRLMWFSSDHIYQTHGNG